MENRNLSFLDILIITVFFGVITTFASSMFNKDGNNQDHLAYDDYNKPYQSYSID